MVTLVGQAGIGKSRLVAELWRAVEADRELIAWRQGRSTPYGEGVTFGALGEIIKAEAGILETDSPDRIYRKIAQATEYALGGDHSGAAWVSAHLRLLLGAADERSIQPARQDEAFAAWRRFLQSLAARRPLVLVVEDLHCADDALLTFIQSLLDRSGGPAGLATATGAPPCTWTRCRRTTPRGCSARCWPTTASRGRSGPSSPPPPAAIRCSPRSTCAC